MGFFASLLDFIRRLFSPGGGTKQAPPSPMRPTAGAPKPSAPPTLNFESFLPSKGAGSGSGSLPTPLPPTPAPAPAPAPVFRPSVPTAEQLDQAFRSAARESNVPELLLRAIATVESRLGQDTGWKRGHPSYGVMQINCGSQYPNADAKCTRPFPTLPEWPSTPRRLLTDHAYNVRLGAIILREQIRRYPGSIPRALAAYNAGPSAIPRDLPIPQLVEYRGGSSSTPRAYALKVLGVYASLGGPDLRAAPELRG